MIEEVKRHLKITWNDVDTEREITNYISMGKARIERLTGTVIDFDSDLVAKEMLLNYCRYAYNNGLEYFEDNFQKEILALQIHEAIKVGDVIDPI